MSGGEPADPRCPECGGPIGATATYCMHCSADLTAARERADADGDGAWDASTPADRRPPPGDDAAEADEAGLLDPEGIVDDSLTVAVGIAGGLVAGLLGTVALLGLTESLWAIPVGVLGWLVVTAHLVRRRTVQGAIARAAYAVAIALVVLPVAALGPGGDIAARLEGFVVGLVVVAVPAAIAAGVGYAASRFVPADGP